MATSWVIMPVFREGDVELKQYQVGFFDPTDSFYPVGDPFEYLGDAMDRAHYLNGGIPSADMREFTRILKLIHGDLQDIQGQMRYIRS